MSGYEVGLNYKKSKKYKSTFGGIMSLTLIVFLLIYGLSTFMVVSHSENGRKKNDFLLWIVEISFVYKISQTVIHLIAYEVNRYLYLGNFLGEFLFVKKVPHG